jgi:hypothetical protein
MNLLNYGGTMTGGSTVVLTPAGLYAGGKASYTTPSHERLTPQVVDFLVTPAVTSKSEPGTARSGLKVALANRVESEGCCNVQPGTVIIDVGFRWPLSQPESLVDDAIKYLQALVFTSAFVDACKKGTLPVA